MCVAPTGAPRTPFLGEKPGKTCCYARCRRATPWTPEKPVRGPHPSFATTLACQCKTLLLWCFYPFSNAGAQRASDHEKKQSAPPSFKSFSVDGNHASLEIFCAGGCGRGNCGPVRAQRLRTGIGAHHGAIRPG